LSFVLGAAILIAVAAVAAYLPAYRASRIEPMVALGR
jgi:ABC-type antimicrobial peptide transport system permease subunit